MMKFLNSESLVQFSIYKKAAVTVVSGESDMASPITGQIYKSKKTAR